jgi:hypothetical protein
MSNLISEIKIDPSLVTWDILNADRGEFVEDLVSLHIKLSKETANFTRSPSWMTTITKEKYVNILIPYIMVVHNQLPRDSQTSQLLQEMITYLTENEPTIGKNRKKNEREN